MPINREALIARLLNAQEKKEVYRVSFRGRAEPLPVIEVDVKELRYNVQNGRLALDRATILHVSEKNQDKDPDDPEVQEEIERLILEQPNTDELLMHLKDETQLQPGIISRDGTLINGNRRLAVLRKLFREGDERFGHMVVGVLPKDATPAEMYLLEVSLQMTPDTRARYGAFTRLVHLRWGIDKHKLDEKRIAHAMYLDLSEVKEQLEILSLADEYLAFIRRPSQYSVLEAGTDEKGKFQHFFELHRLKEKHGREPYWEALLRHFFQLIRGGAIYDDVRELKKWQVEDVVAFGKLLPETEDEQGKQGKRAKKEPDEDLAELAGNLEGIAERVSKVAVDASRAIPLPRGPAKPDPTPEIEPEADADVRATVEAVKTINEIVSTRRAQKRPTELLNHALRKLEAADQAIPEGKAVENDQVVTILGKIVDRAEKLRARCSEATPSKKPTKKRR